MYLIIVGHTKETCYKLLAYPPPIYRNNMRSIAGSGQNNQNYARNFANNVISEPSVAGNINKDETRPQESIFSLGSIKMNQEQRNKIMSLVNVGSS